MVNMLLDTTKAWLRKLKPWQGTALRVLILVIVVGAVFGGIQIDKSARGNRINLQTSSSLHKNNSTSITPKTNTPSVSSAKTPTAPTSAASSSTTPTANPSTAPSKATSTSQGPSDAEIAALYCSGEFAVTQTSDQTNLDNGRLSAIINAQGEINTYNEYGGEAGQTITIASVNQFIDQENSDLQNDYQGYVNGLTPSADEYGCTISLNQETPLPNLNPPATWNP
jgi:hypothetical protein